MSTDNTKLRLTVDIVAAFVGHNATTTDAILDMIPQVYNKLIGIDAPASVEAARPNPPVTIKQSITADYIVCLEDGKKMKMLKRHLQTSYGLSPDEYRARWGLPSNYPMTAPSYAARRSELAKSINLGKLPTGRMRNADAKPTKPAKPSKAAAHA